MLLKLVTGLSESDGRTDAADKLAAHLGSSTLIIFIWDTEIQTLLPAPGFPQTIPNGKLWYPFLENTLISGCFKGTLPFPDISSMQSAVGICGPERSAAILLGGSPSEANLLVLKDILPLLVSLFKKEHELIGARIRTRLAVKSAVKAEKLANTIDHIRVHLNEALIEKENDKKAIEDLMKKKDEFMDMASHELKTPLTSMKGYLQMLQKVVGKDMNPVAVNFAEKANKQVDKLTVLVNDLLDVSKIQAGQMIYNFNLIDVNEFINEVVSQVQVGVSTHKLIVESSIHSVVNIDKHRLEQVIGNFLSNAIKYSPLADKVLIKTELFDSKVRVIVQDFGIGIPAEMLALVFDRFYRVQSSSQHFSGLGIGLYISSEIVKRHGGKVGVSSNSDGTEFYFEIPASMVRA